MNPRGVKVTRCKPGPENPELKFQRYSFDHEQFGETPGSQREVIPHDDSFLEVRKMPRVMAADFLKGQVERAAVECDIETPELIRLIKEFNGQNIGQ